MKKGRVIINKIFNSSKREGLTVIELLVVSVLITMLFGAVSAILLSSSDFWQTSAVRVQLQQELRKAKWAMADELRQSGPDRIIGVAPDGIGVNEITFQKASGVVVGGGIVDWSDDIRFLLSGTGANELHRITGLSDRIIAQHIVDLEFTRYSATPDRLEVSLTAQRDTLSGRTITRDLNFEIYLRN